ncbi:PPK2 family polyphosphate kinase [Kangiella sp. HZ709]|uniref:PPK2 family polyphosphate kinase n=1 Tax=Kangiella sp. HZ709 TaxID=2666328 RepID=UPI0012AF06AF|nr:PPK2 family polyphosphate kinase [Kangiella sp. HZ709]MRX27963.1 polyphosphate kinase 2 family protein [Kangiella sp. HZ709]
MFNTIDHPFLVPTDGSFSLKQSTTSISSSKTEKDIKQDLRQDQKDLDDLQRLLYAHNQFSVLLVFQAMDAAGKDSTIRAVLKGIDPAGCQAFSFKQPSKEELDHDFLWRTAKSLPERGRIGVFNRSYYEEVLVVKVHPEYLAGQRLPYQPNISDNAAMNKFWNDRYESIIDHEKHLARNGTIVLKFFLNVSREEQHRRFLSRIENPKKNWKFSDSDLAESALWDKYQEAYQKVLNTTSKPWAPWYAIPADNKPLMRHMVCEVIRDNLLQLNLQYPQLNDEDTAKLQSYKEQLIITE